MGDAMTTSPITCDGDLTLTEVAKIMTKQKVGSLLIVKGKRILGIITERDIVEKIISQEIDPNSAKVEDFMSRDLVTVEPKSSIIDAMNIMRKNDMRRLPVVEGTDLRGMITAKDVLRIQPELFMVMQEMLEIREAHRKPIYDTDDILGQYEDIMNKNWDN